MSISWQNNPNIISVLGPTGPTGPSGGPPGPVGPTGVQGPLGIVGPTGPQGPMGNVGPQGNSGDVGQTGPQGLTGAQGAQGFQGVTGFTGAQGSTGSQGPTGATGTQGIPGTATNTGATGPTGPSGPTGSQGAAGVAANTGATGATGRTGPTGASLIGPTGAAGNLGPTGSTGARGPTGFTGPQGPGASLGGLTGPAGVPGGSIAWNGSAWVVQGSAGAEDVKLGYNAGPINVLNGAVGIGSCTASRTQLTQTVAVGFNSGLTQSNYSIAIGSSAGRSNQQLNAIAIGREAGLVNQGSNSIAIGFQTGNINQGNNSILIGRLVPTISDNSIAITADNVAWSPTGSSPTGCFFVRPINEFAGNKLLNYNTQTYEITTQDPPITNQFAVVCGGSNQSGTNAAAYYSFDGLTNWRLLAVDTPFSGFSELTAVAYDTFGFVICDFYNTYYSPNGVSAYLVQMPSSNKLESVTYANGLYVVGASYNGSLSNGGIYISKDGRAYQNAVSPPNGTIFATAYAPNISRWVGVSANQIYYSSDADTWVVADTGTFTDWTGQDVLYDGSQFIAVGITAASATTIKRSSDGKNWVDANSVTGGPTFKGRGVAWNGRFYVAVGDFSNNNGSIQYSDDGNNWIAAGGVSTSNITSVRWNGQFFTAGTRTNLLLESSNGFNWGSVPFNLTTDFDVFGIAPHFNNQRG